MNARIHSLAPARLIAALLALALVSITQAAPITKSATGTDLTVGASWGGTAPGSGDVATWASTSLGAGLTLGSSRSWSGISVASAATGIGVTGAGTLTLGTDGINMASSSVDLSLGTPIALGASQTWTVNAGRTLTASGLISGASMILTKGGSGTLKIQNATNTFSGGTIINAGTLFMDVQANAGLGAGPVTLNGGRLYLERITAANALTVNGGDLYPENGFGDNWTGTVTLNSSLIIQGPGYATMTFSGSISGAGGLTLNGQGPVVLAVANSYAGPTSVTACELRCNNKDALGSGALSISSTANSKVNLNYTGTKNIASLTLGGIQQNGGTHGSTASPAANKNDTYFSGSGTVTVPLSPAKDILTFSFGALGAAAVGGSTVNLDVPIGTDRTALAPTLTLSPGATCSPASGVPRNFTSAQTYTVTAQDGSTKAYTVTVTEAVLPNIFTWATSTTGNWSDASKWTNEAVPTIVVAPQAGGRATYTLNFKIAGTYTATHNLNNGFLLNRLNFGGGATTVGGTQSLALTNNGATLPQINQNSGSGVTIRTPLSLVANVTLGGGGSGAVSVSGGISGAGSLTKNNSGALTLSEASTYTGGTTMNAGSVSFGSSANNLLGTGPVVVNSPATLNLNGNNNLTNAFTLNGATLVNGNSFAANLNGPVTLASTSTIDLGTTGNMNIGGNVSGAGGVTKLGTGAGPLVLRGANSFTGPLTVQAGTLSAASFNRVSGGTATSNLGAPANATNGTISLGSTTTAGTLDYSGPGETTDRVIRLGGTTGGALLSQSGTPAGLLTTRGTSGLLKFTSDLSIPGTAGVDNRKTLTLTHVASAATGANPGSGEISGSIGDSLLGTTGQRATSITKAGPGTWTLSGSNTYSGATRVQAGTLAITRPDALGGGSLDITTGAKVRLDYIGTRQISALSFNAGAPQPNGTYGSSGSIATNKDDTRFSGPGTVTVGPVASPTTTALARTAGTEPSNGGVAVTFTATVTGSAPAGTVSFYDGLTLLGSSTLNGASQASLNTTTLGGGTHAITAQYGGNAGNAPSASTPLTQTVVETRSATTTTLASGANPANHGSAVTLTASVSGGATGLVTFYNGSTLLGTATLNSSGQAALTTTALAIGWNAITARYQGDGTRAPSATAAPLFQAVNPPAGNGKTKVFILAGQSNMQGKSRVETGRDPNNYSNTNFAAGLGSLRNMLNKFPNQYGYLADPANPVNGNPGWLKRGDVSVTYWSGPEPSNPNPSSPARTGDLDPYFGNDGEGPTAGNGRMGPEYAFGLVVGSQLADQVLLIKYAFGGKSLAVDFRPPSSGGAVGPYYTGMLSRVNQVLSGLPANSYEIAGFAWHQGWNDRSTTGAAEYEANLTNLINNLRTAWNVPNMPVSIGNTGMANANSDPAGLALVTAQNNVGDPAKHPEFAGTVITVDTRPFDFGNLLGGTDEGYHWNWNAESYFNIGESMGKAMMALRPAPLSSARDILSFEFPGLPATTFSGTNISVTVPYGTTVTALAPVHTVSPLAACAPASQASRSFSTPQTYTVTAQDGSTQAYTVTVSVGPSPFATWAAHPAQGLTTGVNDGPLADPEFDGICNLLEFVLSGAPMVSSRTVLPTLTRSGNNWLFEYDRSDLSLSPATTQVVEYGSELAGWTSVTIPTASAGIVTITPGSPSDHVTVTIPSPGTKGFVRLKVTQ